MALAKCNTCLIHHMRQPMRKGSVSARPSVYNRITPYNPHRGIPPAHQAHLDEYFMLKGLLESCEQIFGKIFSLGDEDEVVLHRQLLLE